LRVLFVCSGNLCRSPMAAVYLGHRAGDAGLEDLVVESAGLLGIEGVPPPSEAVKAMSEAGLDLSDHRSRALRESDLWAADLVIVMTRDHLLDLAERHPWPRNRRVLLRAFEAGSEPSPTAPDLEDPMGKRISAHRRTLETIRQCVDHLVEFLRRERP
jgi:protein-tyrosine-phosphatase